MQLHVDDTAIRDLTKKLSELRRSAFPVAVRQTLNSAAFDVKQKTMPRTSSDAFTHRKPNFFKATSRAEQAKGFNVDSMFSATGFRGDQQAVEDLEAQEQGGSIEGRSFIAMDSARKGKDRRKMVKANARLKAIKDIKDAKKATGKTEGERFVKSVIHAGKGGHVLAEYKGRQILWRVNSLTRTANGQFKLTPLYSYQKGRDVKVDDTKFMEKATQETAKKIPAFYTDAAKKQIAKYLK
jgi:hypothetical protein